LYPFAGTGKQGRFNMHTILFVAVVVVSMLVVMIGAIAFELTGLEKSSAQFQALSCFTGTGFTTKESEQITIYPLRRRIAMFLMIFGNMGFVTMIAAFANSLNPHSFLLKFEPSYLPYLLPPMLIILFNLAVLGAAGYFIYKTATNAALIKNLRERIRRYLLKKKYMKPAPFEELFITSTGYGVVRIDITPESPLQNKAISHSPLSDCGVNVLALERNDEVVPNPPSDTKLDLNDRIVCFGRMEDMQRFAG
jgi:Trk-type K+ transport system membrane component